MISPARCCRRGSRLVDLVCALGRIGQDRNVVGADLHETAADGDELVLLARPVKGQFPIRQRGHQRGMMGQNAQLPLNARGDDHVYIALEDDALSGDYLAV